MLNPKFIDVSMQLVISKPQWIPKVTIAGFTECGDMSSKENLYYRFPTDFYAKGKPYSPSDMFRFIYHNEKLR